MANDRYGLPGVGANNNLRDGALRPKTFITEGMKKRQEMFENYESQEDLMGREVFFIYDFLDNRDKQGIVRCMKGTYYLNKEDIPPGLNVVRGKFSHYYRGETTASYRGLYLVVDDGSMGTEREGTRTFDNGEIAFRVHNYLSQMGRNVEVEDNKIIIYENRMIVDMEIDRFMEQYEGKVDKINRQDRKTRREEYHSNYIDDDYIID